MPQSCRGLRYKLNGVFQMKDIRNNARTLMKGSCRVCPVCNGKACAGEVPGMGGLGAGASFMSNLTALASVRLKMRVIHDAADVDPACEILGQQLSMPVLAAPIGGVSFNMGGAITEGEYIRAVIHGAREAGTLGCIGDGVVDIILDEGLAAVREAHGAGIPFIKPWTDAEMLAKLERAAQAGARIVGSDLDAIGLVTLAKMGKPVSPRGQSRLRSLIEKCDLPFVIKGIMTPEDALLALDAGAKAIVVSNHGGRVLDHTPGTAEVLPEVARAVKGKLCILVDGGIRTGVDVLKMLALGADAVMIGRPVAVAAIGGGAAGVATYLGKLRSELISAMVLTGCQDLSSIGAHILC